MTKESRILLILIIISVCIVFLFYKTTEANKKADEALNIASQSKDDLRQINTKLDGLTDYFKITPKQQIINSIKINKVYPVQQQEIVKIIEQPKVATIEEQKETKKAMEKKEESVVTTTNNDTVNFEEIRKQAIDAVKNNMLPPAQA